MGHLKPIHRAYRETSRPSVAKSPDTVAAEAEAANFIADLSKDLATTARSNGLPFLAHLLDMAHAEAVQLSLKFDRLHADERVENQQG